MANNIPPESQADLRALALALMKAQAALCEDHNTHRFEECHAATEALNKATPPETILALLDSLAEAVRERDEWKRLCNATDDHADKMTDLAGTIAAERDTLQADNERLAGVVAAVKAALPTPEQIELAEPSDDFNACESSGANYDDAYSMGIERGINFKSKQIWDALAAAKEKGKAE